jgi:trans-aconitate 2-methyltransferase
MADKWDPQVYQARRTERGRPYLDLVGRIKADPEQVRTVVDLGCGEGPFTSWLPALFPAARISGVDSSPDMIAEARQVAGDRLTFEVGDVRDWSDAAGTDVVVTNAVLHWVDGHPALLDRWARELRPGSWLAMQVPGNDAAPSHEAIRTVAAAPAWQQRLAGVALSGGPVLDPAGYAGVLTAAGCAVDGWETTYLHELPVTGDEHPVLGWLTGTTLRPLITALDPASWTRFRSELQERLAGAYPIADGRVWFPFRRVFAVARKL